MEKKYFGVYRNVYGVADKIILNFNGNKRAFKKYFESNYNVTIETLHDVTNTYKTAQNRVWSDSKKFQFTKHLLSEFENGIALGNASERQVVNQVIRLMYDPVIFSILEKLEGGGTLYDAMKQFPQIFDDVYLGFIDAFFNGKHAPVEGLQKIVAMYQEKLDTKTKFIKESFFNLLALGGIIVLSYAMDNMKYEDIVSQYGKYGRPAPEGTVMYHNLITNFLYLFPIFILLYFGTKHIIEGSSEKFKIELGKYICFLPVVGNYVQMNSMYNFVNTFSLLRGTSLIPRSIVTMANSTITNYYLKAIFNEMIVSMANGKTIGNEMKEYDVFSKHDLIYNAFSQDYINDNEITSISKIYYDKKTKILNNTLNAIKVCLMLFIGMLIPALYNAYITPQNEIATLMSQSVNNNKSYENN